MKAAYFAPFSKWGETLSWPTKTIKKIALRGMILIYCIIRDNCICISTTCLIISSLLVISVVLYDDDICLSKPKSHQQLRLFPSTQSRFVNWLVLFQFSPWTYHEVQISYGRYVKSNSTSELLPYQQYIPWVRPVYYVLLWDTHTLNHQFHFLILLKIFNAALVIKMHSPLRVNPYKSENPLLCVTTISFTCIHCTSARYSLRN